MNLSHLLEEHVSSLFLTQHESDLNLFSCFNSPLQVYAWLLTLPNNLKVKQITLFVIEAVFVSEQITECRFGAMFEISDKFSFKLNVFSYMILQCSLNILTSFKIIPYDFENAVATYA